MSAFQRDPQDRVRILDEDGTVIDEVPDIDDETLVETYRHMRSTRYFDTRAVSLQRQRRMGTYPPLSGQESTQIGSVITLDEQDWMAPGYREHGASLFRGLPSKQTLLYWMGHEEDNEMPEGVNLFPPTVPIASQIPHVAGVAWAKKLHGKDDTAVICYFGDGVTSEGGFHEGLNLAGVFDTPNVSFCNNSQWAISVSREQQTASETLAQKATTYGTDGVQTDGTDPLAVYSVTKAAFDKAKNPGGGEGRLTLVEAVQHHLGAHTTADDPTVYRDDEKVEKWKTKDPVPRLEAFPYETGRIDDEGVEATEEDVKGRAADAIEAAEPDPRSDPSEMFNHAYAERTPEIQVQYEEFEALYEKFGDEGFLRE